MTRKRDLSGFGFDSPDPPVPPPPSEPPSAPAKPDGARTKPRAAKPARKQRITLSLPTRVAAQLRRAAEAEQRIFLDIVLAAFVEFADAVDEDAVGSRTGLSGSRRRAESGRTQIPLNILTEDLAVMDRRRQAIGLDRSAYVTELLVRAFS